MAAMSAQEAIEIQVGSIQPTISTSIRVLLAAAGEDQNELAEVIKASETTVSRKLSGNTKWTPDDIYNIAGHFSEVLGMEIDPGSLFLDASDLLAGVQKRKKMIGADLRVLAGGARTTPDRAMLFPVDT